MPNKKRIPPVCCRSEECPLRGMRHSGIHIHAYQKNGEIIHKCTLSGKTFSPRKGTPFANMKRKPKELIQAMKLVSRGTKEAAIIDALEITQKTLNRWIEKAAEHCGRFIAAQFVNLKCKALQFDEIKSYEGKKDNELWIWQAIDPKSKLWLHVQVTRSRDGSNASRIVRKVWRMIKEPEMVAIISTDGLQQYETPVLHCFKNAAYVQIIKEWGPDGPKEIKRKVITGESMEYAKRMFEKYEAGKGANTAYTERLNGTIRAYVSRLIRRTYGYAKSIRRLQQILIVAQCAYNFLRAHRTLSKGRGKTTPAMAAGLADHALTWDELFHAIV